ncbi:MAG: nucleotidyltransferase family protein [Pseudomonadota bacterium]
MNDGALLLAAGSSRRFGSDKRHHRLDDGTPLLVASVRRYASAFAELVVVLRPDDDELAERARDAAPRGAVTILRCPDAHRGMGHSLAWGARHAPPWAHLFVALGDMPWVRTDTLVRLRQTAAAAPADAMVRPAHRSVPGHPVAFGRDHVPALARLTGDRGARALLEAHPHVRLVEVDDPGVLADLDTPPEVAP